MIIEHDRPAQLLMAGDPQLDYDEARARIERAALAMRIPADLNIAQEAAALSIAAGAVRMFKGGVFIEVDPMVSSRLGIAPGRPLFRALRALGCRDLAAPEHALTLELGRSPGADLYVWQDGWDAAAGPEAPPGITQPGNELSGMLSGALAVSIAFRRAVIGDVLAGRRAERLSAWGPEAPVSSAINFLPSSLWLLGLGNLGQATLFGLTLLPYRDRADVRLVLQDGDRAGPENLEVQVLTEHAWIGRRKARAAAEWCDAVGFDSLAVERRFGPNTRPERDDPRTLLAGVDNLETRRWAAASGFDVVIDAGLGASAPEAFDLRLHAFPGRKTPEAAWPATAAAADERPLPPGLATLVRQGRIDRCGAVTLAGKSVGVPCTALAAAALQLGQLCRLIATGRCADFVDASLATTADAAWRVMETAPRRPGFVAA